MNEESAFEWLQQNAPDYMLAYIDELVTTREYLTLLDAVMTYFEVMDSGGDLTESESELRRLI